MRRNNDDYITNADYQNPYTIPRLLAPEILLATQFSVTTLKEKLLIGHKKFSTIVRTEISIKFSYRLPAEINFISKTTSTN